MFSCGQPLGASSKAGEMMTDNEKLAEVLWLSQATYPAGYGGSTVENGRQVSTGKYDTKMIKRYLASPAGEKVVRDKVRELCPNGSSICYVYFPDLLLGHRLGIDIPGSPEFDCATEAEAYAAVLLWLVKQKGVSDGR